MQEESSIQLENDLVRSFCNMHPDEAMLQNITLRVPLPVIGLKTV